MERYNGITGLKGIAILAIVFLHVVVNGNYNINSIINEEAVLQLANMVKLFFMLSSFGMCCGYYEKIKNNNINLNEFYGKRYKKILPFFALIVLAEVIFSGMTKKVFIEAFLDLTLMFGFLPKGNIEVVGVGWTLGVIFAFYVLFPFFVFLLWNKKRAWFVFGVALIMKFGCGKFFVNDDSIVMVNLLLWSVQFITGGLIFLYKDIVLDKLKNKIIQGAIIMLGAGGLIVNGLYWQSNIVMDLLLLLIFGMFIVYAISNKSFLLENKLIQNIGKYCLEIYLAHMMIFRIIEKLSLKNFIENQVLSLVVIYVITVVGALMFGWIVNSIINKIVTVHAGRDKNKFVNFRRK